MSCHVRLYSTQAVTSTDNLFIGILKNVALVINWQVISSLFKLSECWDEELCNCRMKSVPRKRRQHWHRNAHHQGDRKVLPV